MYRELIKYIILYCIICGISIGICYLNYIMEDINYTLQFFLMNFFQFISWIILIIGVVRTLPKYKLSNKRVWFYYTIMMSIVGVIKSFAELINTLI